MSVDLYDHNYIFPFASLFWKVSKDVQSYRLDWTKTGFNNNLERHFVEFFPSCVGRVQLCISENVHTHTHPLYQYCRSTYLPQGFFDSGYLGYPIALQIMSCVLLGLSIHSTVFLVVYKQHRLGKAAELKWTIVKEEVALKLL